MDFMKECEDNAFDLAIVDPPYGIGMSGGLIGNSKQDYKHFHGNDAEAPPEEYYKEMFRVSKNQIIWGANHFIEKFAKSTACWIVWDKVQPEKFTMAMCELAWTSFDSPAKIYKQRIVGADKTRIHPTQKPVKLYEWLLTNYAKPDQKILDTHSGSMSLAIACHNLGYAATIIEIDEDYFNAAIERIENHVKQILTEHLMLFSQ